MAPDSDPCGHSRGVICPSRQLITTVTSAPPGLNTRCTCIFPGPSTVTLTVVLASAANVPDIGETMTFLVRPGGSETDQSTGPPEAVSVIVPGAGGTTSSVAGLILSSPETGMVLAAADAALDARACVASLVGIALAPEVALALAVPPVRLGAVPAAPVTLGAGAAPLVTPVILPSAGRATW